MDRDKVSSPPVTTEAIMITEMIKALEGRDVATCDIPNAFVQIELNEHDLDGHRNIMKILGPLVDILIEIDSEYEKFVVTRENDAVLYVHVLKHYMACWYQQCYSTRNSRMISLDMDSK